MPSPIYTFLTVDDFPQIRALIDTSFAGLAGDDPENPFPDTLIEMPIYLGVAENWLLGKLPLAASYTGANLQTVKNAIIYYTASLLAPALTSFTKENFGDYSYTRTNIDTAQLAGQLVQRALISLFYLLNNSGIPTLFDLASANRGRL